MLFFRNPEIKRMVVVYGVLAAGASCLGIRLLGIQTGGYVLAVCIMSEVLFLLYTSKRYEEIKGLSEKVDLALHGELLNRFAPDKEGELALLSSEIYKLTVRLNEQAEQLQKEKAYLTSSIADISHQVKTPLTSIRMIVPRLGRTDLNEEERWGLILEIGGLTSRMEWLINALLKIARLESDTVVLDQRQIDVEALVNEALKPLEVLADIKSVSLEIMVQPRIFYKGDFQWSVEALGNILKNCLEHTPEGGAISIAGSENPLYTEITVSDTGEGINPEDLPHLFDRFYKGKDSGMEHAGIGLNLAAMIINRHNGVIKAENQKSGGARFRIRFYKGAV